MSDLELGAQISSGTGKKTLRAYITGVALSLILTIIPFVIVAKKMASDQMLYVSITVLAIIQLFVQVIFFLRLNVSPEGRWNVMSFVFTIIVVLTIVFGSLWIMYNLNYYMVH